jgi:hypothetical protein
MQYLEGIVRLDCSKKEDMVSIALSSARLPLVYSDYLNTCADIIWIMTPLTIASRDVLHLAIKGTTLEIPDGNGTRTVLSWVK